MKFSRALILSCLALTSRGSLSKHEQPNPDYPGTRDVFWKTRWEDAVPMFIAVPDDFSLEQVECAEIAGRLASFSNGEIWMTLGGKRVLRFARDVFNETRALEKGHELSAYPLVASSEELDALLAEVQPLEELRAALAERNELWAGSDRMQAKRILMFGCTACHCPRLFDEKGVC